MRRVALADADQSDAIVKLSGDEAHGAPLSYGQVVHEFGGEWFFADAHDAPVQFGPFASRQDAETVLQAGDWRRIRT